MSITQPFFAPQRLVIAIALALSGPSALAAIDCTVNIATDDGTGDTANTLSWAIVTANNGATPTTPYSSGHPGGGCNSNTITLATDMTVTGVMKRLIDSNLTLDGQNHTLSGNDAYRPLFVKSGTVTIQNLTFGHGQAQGGAGRNGGGGAGLGGALFAYSGTVTVKNVTFSGNTATGGQGASSAAVADDGGGGMFGNSLFSGGGLFGNGGRDVGGYGGAGAYGGGGGSFGGDGGLGGFGGGGGFGNQDRGGDGGFGGGGGSGSLHGGLGGFGGGGGNAFSGGGAGGFGGGGGYGDSHSGASGGYGGGFDSNYGGGGAGFGGALFVKRGTLILQNVSFGSNSAVGGTSWSSSSQGQGRGGAVFVCTSDLDNDNTAKGAKGGCSASIDEVSSCGVTFSGGVAAQGQPDLFWKTGASGGAHSTAGITDVCPPPVMSVQGNGVPITNGDATPTSADGTDFGATSIGSPRSHTFMIQNAGVVALNLTGVPDRVALTGAGCALFSVITQPTTPVASTTSGTAFTVRYMPTSATQSDCTVSIANDDATHNPYTFALAGTGVKVATTTTVTSAPNPSAYGQSVTLTATVDPITATGTVDFSADGNALADCANVALTGSGDNKTATCTTASLMGGTHTLRADYSGDANNQTSAGTLQQSVQNSFTGPSATGQGDLTATVSGGGSACNLTQAAFVTPSSTPPAGYTFPYGLLRFTLGDACDGSAVTVQVTYPTALPAGAKYWKYGKTADNPTAHWYELTTATLAGNTVTFTLTDGQKGDDDLTVNRSISDDGGVGVPVAGAPATGIPTLSEWALLLLTGLLGLLSWQSGKIKKRWSV